MSVAWWLGGAGLVLAVPSALWLVFIHPRRHR